MHPTLTGLTLATTLVVVGCGSVPRSATPPGPAPAATGPAPIAPAAPPANGALRFPSIGTAAAEAASAYASHQSFLGSGMSGPNGLAIDAQDTLYESDYYRGTVTRVTQAGAVSTYASGFSGPAGLAFDKAGNLYCAEYESHQLSRIPPGGGSRQPFVTQGLKNPVWPAVDSKGTLYLADYNNSRIALVHPDGSTSTFATIPGVNAIAIDPQDQLWITTWGGTVVRVTPSGQQTTVATGIYSACGIAWSPSFVAVVTYGGESSRDGTLVLVDMQGQTYKVASGLDKASSVIFDSQGSVYTANCGDVALRKYALR
ncbi:MAG TPA: NHL repeat-containing protein [Stenomitos sp.]